MIILQKSVLVNIFLVFMTIFTTVQHVPHPPQSWDPSLSASSLLCPFSQAHSLGLSWSPPDGRLHLQTSEWNKIWANLMWLFSPPDQHDNTVNGNTTVLDSWLLLRRREFEKMWEQCYFIICMYTRYFIHLLTSILGKGIQHHNNNNISDMALFLCSLDTQGLSIYTEDNYLLHSINVIYTM